jgi:Planctomycete cytochrome C
MLEIGAVAVLAGFCMAAGWWIVHGRNSQASAPAPQLALTPPAKPAPQMVVGPEPAKPVDKRADKPTAPPSPKDAPKPPAKPTIPETKPSVPPPSPPPAPPKSADKPTTTLTFQKDIQSILQAKCILCHGDKNKFKGNLDLRTLRSLEKGGDSGPAINRQDPETSPIWDSVSSGQMPPGKTKLSESEKKKLHEWIVGGGK